MVKAPTGFKYATAASIASDSLGLCSSGTTGVGVAAAAFEVWGSEQPALTETNASSEINDRA